MELAWASVNQSMKTNIQILAFACIFLTAACSSLRDSSIDEQMRFQGSFSCGSMSQENPAKKETLSEADVSRVRCAKDEWQIHGEQVIFTRTLYQLKICENVLGRIEFKSPDESSKKVLRLAPPHCKLVRLNPNWLGEASGKCMLNKLSLSTPYDLKSVYHCRNYVPDFCEAPIALQIESIKSETDSARDPHDQIDISREGGSRLMSCKRYEAD
jgi:hypothetical protein